MSLEHTTSSNHKKDTSKAKMDRINVDYINRRQYKKMRRHLDKGFETMNDNKLDMKNPDSFYSFKKAFDGFFERMTGGVKIEDLQEDEFVRFPMATREEETDVPSIIGSDGVSELFYYVAHKVLSSSVTEGDMQHFLYSSKCEDWSLQKKLSHLQQEALGPLRPTSDRLKDIVADLKFEPEDDGEQMAEKLMAFEALADQVKVTSPRTTETERQLVTALCCVIEEHDAMLERRAHEFRQWFVVGDYRAVPDVSYPKALNIVKGILKDY